MRFFRIHWDEFEGRFANGVAGCRGLTGIAEMIVKAKEGYSKE